MTQPTKSIILYSLISILVVYCLAWTAGGTFSTGAGGGGESCTSCTEGTSLVDSNASGAEYGTGNCRAMLFTLSSGKCIKGVVTNGFSGENNANTITCDIYNTSAGQPTTAVSGLSVSVATSALPHTSATDYTWTFTNAVYCAAGTYAVLIHGAEWWTWTYSTGDNASFPYLLNAATDCSGAWTEYNFYYDIEVLGCDPE